MSFEQAAILIVLGGILAAFYADRFRMEVVSMTGVMAAYLMGLVPPETVFSGFSNPAVITVIEILLIVQVFARSRLFEGISTRLLPQSGNRFTITAGICAMTGFASIFMNNIGALALALPVVFRISAASGIPLKQLLIPVSFSALLGGLNSLIGTPANLLVSEVLRQETGQGFHFFDFAYVGLPVTVAGIAIIAAWSPRLFPEEPQATPRPVRGGGRIVSEVTVPPASPLSGTASPDCRQRHGIVPLAIFRDGQRVFARPEDIRVRSGDRLLIETSPQVLQALLASGGLRYAPDALSLESGSVHAEAVVMPQSTLIGSSISSLHTFRSRGIAVTGISTRSTRIEGRLADIRLSIGDILHLHGSDEAIADALDECECVRLAASGDELPANSWAPVVLFGAGVLFSATNLLKPELAFGVVLLALAALRFINLRTALADINWPIIIMLACMIVLGKTVETTGAAALLASGLEYIVPLHQPLIAIGCILALAVLLTPFIDNASVAIILSPVAIELARMTGQPPGPFLIAVALGASTDFITPFGHHNNTLTMGIGGYRFSDFFCAGWPLTLSCLGLGLLLLKIFWL